MKSHNNVEAFAEYTLANPQFLRGGGSPWVNLAEDAPEEKEEEPTEPQAMPRVD